ncbi:AcrR family transcriptional regulator [Crossiella equi]|uniref:AcrR family transcriptional regulator n=1 Tax=Crossiella equi TaxID=130796 RepID=A0ABS5AFE2_9PSEU|nr:TetR/AcrR family transcriptional regulator [Crossiella equi]MBP2475305.1 AcrR family transcriptional regulator [Crossiella equi]
MRADAKRNRDLLLASAVRLFTERGMDTTLDAVAKDAGVGIGTLYRHFPTREALIEAAYRSELAAVCAAADELLAELPPERALRVWMDRFVDYLITKAGLAPALNAVIDSGGNPYSDSMRMLTDCFAKLLGPSGLRQDVLPEDLVLGVAAVGHFAVDRREQAGRVLDLLMDGLRHRS